MPMLGYTLKDADIKILDGPARNEIFESMNEEEI